MFITCTNTTRSCTSIFFVGGGKGGRAYSRSVSIGRWRHEVLSRLRERNAKQLEPYKKFELAIERVLNLKNQIKIQISSLEIYSVCDCNYAATLSVKPADN